MLLEKTCQKRLSYEKGARKMLMKLTHGIAVISVDKSLLDGDVDREDFDFFTQVITVLHFTF
jgi:hypothetical protein